MFSNIKIFLFLFFLSSWCLPGLSQLSISTNSHDFGSIHGPEEAFYDFKIKNNSAKKVFILRAATTENIIVKYSSKTIEPGKEEFIRMKYISRGESSFNEQISVYFSDRNKPVKFKLSGNAQYKESTGDVSCPDFSRSASVKQQNPDVTVKVIDESTNEPIEDAAVDIYVTPWSMKTYKTNRSGEVSKNTSLGYKFFQATKEGYSPVNKQQNMKVGENFVLLKLKKDANEVIEREDMKVIVKDKVTNEPIYSANVEVKHKTHVKDDHLLETTDNDGTIEFPAFNDEDYCVSANADGYKGISHYHAGFQEVNKKLVVLYLEPEKEKKLDPVSASNQMKVIVKDRYTKDNIPSAFVQIKFEDRKPSEINDIDEFTNANGILPFDAKDHKQLNLTVGANEYETNYNYHPGFREIKNGEIIVYLDRKEEEALEEPRIEPAGPEIVNGELNKNLFKPNNIVFLIDVSTSMKQRDRMDVLKVAMIELLSHLRDVDYLSVVTYSSTTDVKLTSISASEKEKIAEVIFELEAGGLTAGGKGLDKAYEIARDNFIADGNNEVFIATDGAFNVGGDSKGLLPKVEKECKKGVNLSVIGVKSGMVVEDGLKSLAKKGKGAFVKIKEGESPEDKILEAVKDHSRIN